MVSSFTTFVSGEDAGGNSDERADQERDRGEFKSGGIVFDDDFQHGLLEAEGFAEVSVQDAGEVAAVLHGEWQIEAQRVAKLREVFGAGAFAEHLSDRIAGNDVCEEENHGQDEPQRGKREEQAD